MEPNLARMTQNPNSSNANGVCCSHEEGHIKEPIQYPGAKEGKEKEINDKSMVFTSVCLKTVRLDTASSNGHLHACSIYPCLNFKNFFTGHVRTFQLPAGDFSQLANTV